MLDLCKIAAIGWRLCELSVVLLKPVFFQDGCEVPAPIKFDTDTSKLPETKVGFLCIYLLISLCRIFNTDSYLDEIWSVCDHIILTNIPITIIWQLWFKSLHSISVRAYGLTFTV